MKKKYDHTNVTHCFITRCDHGKPVVIRIDDLHMVSKTEVNRITKEIGGYALRGFQTTRMEIDQWREVVKSEGFKPCPQCQERKSPHKVSK